MATKICRICKEEKDITLFKLRRDSRDGYRNECKKCCKRKDSLYYEKTKEIRRKRVRLYYLENKEYIKYKSKQYREEHKDVYLEYNKDYYARNKDEISKKQREYNQNHKNEIRLLHKKYREEHVTEIKEMQRIYKETHKQERNRKDKKYRDDNLSIKISIYLRNRIAYVLKYNKRSYTLIDILGCDLSFFMTYIESLWLDGMSWDNYGKYGWHIDHIRPCASFDLSEVRQQRECFHYTNLQPLWADDNLKKNSFYDGKFWKFKKS